jgi:cytochrome c peroxidase
MQTSLLLAVVLVCSCLASPGLCLEPIEELGKALFFDASLSNPPGQSCAACHGPEAGGTGPDSAVNATGAVEPGVVHTRAGNRKPPTFAYGGFTPILHKCGGNAGDCMSGGMGGDGTGGGGMGSGGMGSGGMSGGMSGGGMSGGGMSGGGMGGGGMGGGGMMADTFAGGIFWDGRATGWTLGDPLAEQAMGPFLNPLEMNNPNAKFVCLNVMRTGYAVLFEEVWGPGSLDCVKNVSGTYERIARSIAAYERSAEVSPFNSRFDEFWRQVEAKRAVPRSGIPAVWAINGMNWVKFKGLGLTDAELAGLAVFNGKGKCSTCHLLQPMHGSSYPLFTDFRYHNLGVPKNPMNPFYAMPRPWNPDGANWVDQGLGGFLAKTAGMKDAAGTSRDYTEYAADNYGKHRTPTLRNADLRPAPTFVKAFGHNGYFKSLQEIIHFYNLRDVLPVCEVPDPPKDRMGGATCFPPPEVAENINRTDMGSLGLTPQEGMALIGFLKTLSDSYTAP